MEDASPNLRDRILRVRHEIYIYSVRFIKNRGIFIKAQKKITGSKYQIKEMVALLKKTVRESR